MAYIVIIRKGCINMKKFLLLLSALLLTGCSVNYDLTITNKEKVKEKFYVYEANDKILESHGSINEYLNKYASLYSESMGSKGYTIKTKKGNPSSYFIVTKTYSNLDDYVLSNTFRTMFNSANVERNGGYTTVVTSRNAYIQSIKNDELVSENSKYDTFKISIKFYNEVIDTNANEVDKKNNIYTWHVSEENGDGFIYFKTGPKVMYKVVFMDYIADNLLAVIITSGTILLIAFTTLYLYAKSKKNNEV